MLFIFAYWTAYWLCILFHTEDKHQELLTICYITKTTGNFQRQRTAQYRGSVGLVRQLLLCLLSKSTLNCSNDIQKYIQNQLWDRFSSSMRRWKSVPKALGASCCKFGSFHTRTFYIFLLFSATSVERWWMCLRLAGCRSSPNLLFWTELKRIQAEKRSLGHRSESQSPAMLLFRPLWRSEAGFAHH